MTLPHPDSQRARIERLERRQRVLFFAAALNFLTLPLLAFTAGGTVRAGAGALAVDSLRVREVAVVDSLGVVRARLGAHLPDAVIDGRRMVRGTETSGLMLYDSTGVERGGYVTFGNGNIALTLDSRARQVAMFTADAESGAVVRLWHDADFVEMRSGRDGSRLSVGKGGTLEAQLPAMSAAEETVVCTGLRSDLARLATPISAADAFAACRTRMSAGACRSCLSP
jgi:hypothetical protein